jgi:shikimate kinase
MIQFLGEFPTLVVLYACEIFKIKEEHRLRMLENRVLRRTFGPKRDEVTGGCRNLRNEELHNVKSSANIIIMIKSRNLRWVGHVARMGRREMRVRYWWKGQRERDH